MIKIRFEFKFNIFPKSEEKFKENVNGAQKQL